MKNDHPIVQTECCDTSVNEDVGAVVVGIIVPDVDGKFEGSCNGSVEDKADDEMVGRMDCSKDGNRDIDSNGITVITLDCKIVGNRS